MDTTTWIVIVIGEQEAQLRADEADRAREAAQSHLEDAARLDPPRWA